MKYRLERTKTLIRNTLPYGRHLTNNLHCAISSAICFVSLQYAISSAICFGSLQCAISSAICFGSLQCAISSAICFGSLQCALSSAICFGLLQCDISSAICFATANIRLHWIKVKITEILNCTKHKYTLEECSPFVLFQFLSILLNP